MQDERLREDAKQLLRVARERQVVDGVGGMEVDLSAAAEHRGLEPGSPHLEALVDFMEVAGWVETGSSRDAAGGPRPKGHPPRPAGAERGLGKEPAEPARRREADRRETRSGKYHPMVHLATDYIHPTPRGGRCRVRVYLPEDEQDAPVVVCSELPTNEGSSLSYAAEQLAAEVIRYHRLPTPIVWIEHHPPETTDGSTETFDLASFSSYEVTERAPYLGETRLSLGEATCKRITRGMVEVLIGAEV